jgi:hypothetical protein
MNEIDRCDPEVRISNVYIYIFLKELSHEIGFGHL